MLSTITAIVLRPKDPVEDFTPPVNDTPRTPFEEFMAALGSRYRASAKSMVSAAAWTAFPYEQAVADGLWLIFIRTAERLGLKLTTSEHVMSDIAPRVNRVLNGAFFLVYATMEEAAEAFDQRVAQSVAPSSNTAPLSEAWAIESAKFFAELIKASHDLADKIDRVRWNLDKHNILQSAEARNSHLDILLLQTPDTGDDPRVSEQTGSGDRFANRLRLASDHDSMIWMDPRNYLSDLKIQRRQQKALEKLPVHLNRIPDQIMGYLSTFSIERHWISTQLLLTSADAPVDLEYLEAETYLAGLRRLKTLTTDEVRRRFHTRMRARNAGYDPALASILDPVLETQINNQRRWSEVLDLSVKSEILIDSEGIELKHEIVDDSTMSIGDVSIYDGAENERKLATKLIKNRLEKTDWSDVDEDEFREMLKREEIPYDMLIDAAHRLTVEQRGWLIGAVLAAEDNSAESGIVTTLFERGLIPVDDKHVSRWLHSLPEHLLEEAFRNLVDGKESGLLDSWESERLSFRILLRLTRKKAVKLAVTPAARMYLSHPLRELKPSGGSKDDPSRAMMVEHLGQALYRRLILASGIIDHEGAYQEEERDKKLPPWSKRFTEKDFGKLLLTKNKRELAKLASVYTEDACFRWAYASEPDVKAKLKAYQKAREAYY